MKNILIVNSVYDPEPVVSARIGKSLAGVLYECGENVEVVAPFPSRPMGFEFINYHTKTNDVKTFVSKERLNCYHLPSFIYPKSGIIGRFLESMSFGFACYKFIMSSQKSYDMVYMNTWPIFGQLGVTLACLRKKIPYIVHIMDVYPESISKRLFSPLKQLVEFFLMPIEKVILKKAHRIIAISNKMKIYLEKSRGLREDKISVVYNWQDEDEFRVFPKVFNEKRVFMYLGNIGPVACIPFLIECFEGLDAKLIIAGTGSEKLHCIEFSKKFKNLVIEFLDVPDGKVAEVQSMADVMILPIMKGFANTSIPSKLPAYMMSSKPVLAIADLDSDSVDTVTTSNCGWVVEFGDTELVRAKVNEILSVDQQILEEKGLLGFQYAKSHFSKTQNLLKLKKELIDDIC